MGQVFYASPTDTFTWPNGAIGHWGGGSFGNLGPYAKVANCPIDGHPTLRLTCYATKYSDSLFSIPACTRRKGRHIPGFFTMRDGDIVFVPMRSHQHLIGKCHERQLHLSASPRRA